MTKLEIFKQLQKLSFGWRMKRPNILKDYTKEELIRELEKESNKTKEEFC